MVPSPSEVVAALIATYFFRPYRRDTARCVEMDQTVAMMKSSAFASALTQADDINGHS